MGIPLRFALLIVFYSLLNQPLCAQGERKSAVQYYWGCQYLINDPVPVTADEIEQSGKCQAAISNVLNFNKELPSNMAFCPPIFSSGAIDSARIVVHFMKNNTPRLAERFDMMAYAALRAAWPCS